MPGNRNINLSMNKNYILLDDFYLDKINNIIIKENLDYSAIILAILNILLSRYLHQDKIAVSYYACSNINEKEIKITNYNTILENVVTEETSFITLCKKLKKSLKTIVQRSSQNVSSTLSIMDSTSTVFIDCNSNNNMENVIINNEEKIYFMKVHKNNKIHLYINNNIKDKFFPVLKIFKKHFFIILDQIINNLTYNIHELEIITDDEKEILLNKFNNNKEEYDDWFIVKMFENIVRQNPENTMIVLGNEKITYSGLNKKANQLARFLQETLRVGPGVFIALYADVSIEMIIGIFAILKAGGTYVPLDPDNPDERNKYILQDSGADIILYSSKNEITFFKNKIINISLENKKIYTGSDKNLKIKNKFSDIVYVIYTSGTSGKPKGVMITHENISNTLLWRIKEYNFNTNDNILQLFSHAFDGFITSFFTPALSGAVLVLITKEEMKEPGIIAGLIKSNKISYLLCIPPLFQAMMDIFDDKILNSIKRITLAGDKAEYKIIKRFNKKYPHIELINEYGPTENSVVSTIKRNLQNDKLVTIGKPISNTNIYILNNKNKLLPIGAAGEICLSGKGLSSGYLNNPGLSEKMFISNPFINGQLMYKTGDLGRWLPDGNIEFLGRIDFQVKIRGYRVELNEIENCILKHEKINETAVTVSGKTSQNKFLCAFYTTVDNNDINNMKEFLSGKLPGYMMPSFFIRKDKLDLTENGKIDRKKLSETADKIFENNIVNEYFDEVESQVEKIWKDLLKIDNIGLKDSFFSIGGNSILIIQMQVMVEKHFNIKLSAKNPEKYSTVSTLSSLIKDIINKKNNIKN